MSVLDGTQCWKKVTVWEVIRGKGLALLADSDELESKSQNSIQGCELEYKLMLCFSFLFFYVCIDLGCLYVLFMWLG